MVHEAAHRLSVGARRVAMQDAEGDVGVAADVDDFALQVDPVADDLENGLDLGVRQVGCRVLKLPDYMDLCCCATCGIW